MDLLFQIKRGNEAVGENKGNGVYSITKKKLYRSFKQPVDHIFCLIGCPIL
jgi:hypothetical protein